MNDELNPPSDTGISVRRRSQSLKGGLDPAEMGRRSGQVRRERRAAREAQADERELTFRQRLGLSLSRLTQEELDAAVKKMAGDAGEGKAQAMGALARMADQAFGKSQPEEPPTEEDEVQKLTRAERSAIIARLLAEARDQQAAAGDDSDPRDV